MNMPLQKLPPHGPLSVSASSSQRPQLSNRRRTLQTISELSTTDGSLPDFVSSIGIENIRRLGHDSVPGVARATPIPLKRQSLPQYRSDPGAVLTRPTTAITSVHPQGVRHSRSTLGRRPVPVTIEQVEGWNAKRERARMQHELAITEAKGQRRTSDKGVNMTMAAVHSGAQSRPRSIGLPAGQLKQLRSSNDDPSMLKQVERHTSKKSATNSFSQDDAQPETSERASTDSSSYQSRDSAVKRSRSGSSNTSYASQDAPPLPHGSTIGLKGYCAELILQNQNLVSFGESARSKNLNPSRSSRTLSLPNERFQYNSTQHHSYATTPDLYRLPSQQHRAMSAQRARNQALAALTAVNSYSQAAQRPQYPANSTYISSHQNRHASLTSHPPMSSMHRKSGSPHRNSMRYHVQRDAQRRITSPSPTSLNNTNHNSVHRHSDLSRGVKLEQRTVPKRESLTQWKKEREEAKVNTCTDHRTIMRERVRRANELEEEREKELVSMGKRPTKAESRSCFGGLFAALRTRNS